MDKTFERLQREVFNTKVHMKGNGSSLHPRRIRSAEAKMAKIERQKHPRGKGPFGNE